MRDRGLAAVPTLSIYNMFSSRLVILDKGLRETDCIRSAPLACQGTSARQLGWGASS